MNKYIAQIRESIEQGNIKDAIQKALKIEVDSVKNTIIALSARYKVLQNKKNTGTLSSSEEGLEERQIIASLLSVLQSVDDNDEIPIRTDESEWKSYIQKQAFVHTLDTETPLSEKGVSILHKKTFEDFLSTERVQEELLIEEIEIKEGQELAALNVFDLAKENWLLKGTALAMGERKALKEICPTAYPTKFVVYDDNNGIDLRITKELNGNLYLQYKEAIKHIRQNLYLERDLHTRTEEYEIPLRVLQEIVANAFIHRDYGQSVDSFIQIEIYPNRIEIKNPGLFPKGLSLENIEKEVIASKFQNPSVAHIFYLLGIVEKLGSGIKRAQDILQEKGHKRAVFFQSPSTNEVKVTIFKKNGATNGVKYVENTTPVLLPPPVLDNLPLDKEGYLLGRKAALEQLHTALQGNGIMTLVNGMGGIGKSTLAAFYATFPKYRAAYSHCFWITVSDLTGEIEEALISAFLVALELYQMPKEAQLQKIQAYLRSLDKPVLLIIDNANFDENVEKNQIFLQKTGCKVLITTRANIQGITQQYLSELLPEDAFKLFTHYFAAGKDHPLTRQLLQNIAHHTLLTEFMAKSLNTNLAITIEQLVEITAQQDFTNELLAYTKFKSYHTYTHTTSFEKIQPAKYLLQIFPIQNLSEQEQQILRYFSILPTEWIEMEILLQIFAADKEKATRLQLGQVLQSLHEKGWLQKSPTNAFACHILLQHLLRQQLQPNTENCALLLQNLYNAIQFDGYTNKLTLAPYLPIIDAVLSWIKEETALIADIYENSAAIYEAIGNYAQALGYNLENVRIKEKILAVDDADLAICYNNIAETYQYVGEYQKSLEYALKALAIQEKVLSPENTDLAISYNNIGITYIYLGDYQKALAYGLEALVIQEKVLSPEHPYLATSYNNIASAYEKLGDYQKALEYDLKAITIREKVLSAEHPDLATSYNNIALTYYHLKDYATAYSYIQKAVTIRIKVLPQGHPYIQSSLNTKAMIEKAMRKK